MGLGGIPERTRRKNRVTLLIFVSSIKKIIINIIKEYKERKKRDKIKFDIQQIKNKI